MKKLHYTTAEKLAMNSFIIPWDESNKQTIWAMHLHIYFLTKIIALKNVNHLSIQEPFKQYCVVNTKFSPNSSIQWFGKDAVHFFFLILRYLMTDLVPVVNKSRMEAKTQLKEQCTKLDWENCVKNNCKMAVLGG